MLQKLQDDLKGALMAKDELKLSTIRFLLAAIKNFQIEKQRELTDEDVVSVIQKQVKQHQESIEGFQKGNRVEMVKKEGAELAILQSYLPEQMSREEVEKMVTAAISQVGAKQISDMGAVMAELSSQLKGKADMSFVSSLVREKLS
ncbi:MAG: hypothetical protein A3F35_02955 [Candidatus Woykebacteria bacterium RIFCSPHIGHO2_12_FULL_45_10]|uniref:Glutamyl-tRNA amidotransferase n=1 Tax=Candidatus Woykebacteria bacterium RIFCSPHIGHO2_12_FULL_45_10 TaxID=1802603 RepID=A0A1G1WQE5_9BACT|nr:MAG: hypothetical protein A3F35_02955 [Candidatus Woykebacteria bacterium RIFCSPHIGHO2_12_FULL_45_10]